VGGDNLSLELAVFEARRVKNALETPRFYLAVVKIRKTLKRKIGDEPRTVYGVYPE